ncbi:hypothetical protein E2562_026703 [Oryza meyeriana var. granulata]|uniref:Uncharacterized protein n=1 Tax=Oryza meyeriana var. granulata TaxID=110450 RepID=A0A6G1E250_9ORYZ|nr:hypothetical protein E2562_026703 [Oryza meyeriana var. granulata]
MNTLEAEIFSDHLTKYSFPVKTTQSMDQLGTACKLRLPCKGATSEINILVIDEAAEGGACTQFRVGPSIGF